MSCPPVYNGFCLQRGDDQEIRLRKRDSEGVPVTIAGWSARMQFRADPNGALILEKAATIDGTQFVFSFTPADLLILNPDNVDMFLMTDIETMDTGGNIATWVKANKVKILSEVTYD